MQNGFIEDFHNKLRGECLNANWLTDLEHTQRLLDAWVGDYNEARPHSALDRIRRRKARSSATTEVSCLKSSNDLHSQNALDANSSTPRKAVYVGCLSNLGRTFWFGSEGADVEGARFGQCWL